MNQDKAPSYTLTIYLIKDAYDNFDDILNEESLVNFKLQSTNAQSESDLAKNESLRLYVKNDYIGPPDWAKLFNIDINRMAASGLYLRKIDNKIMAVAFGSSGRFLLKESAIVRRFGLMTVLNSVEPTSLRSIDKTVLSESGLQARTQSSQPSDSTAFGIDIQQDLVRNISGKAKDKNLYGSTIVGRDSLTVTIKVTPDTLDSFLREYLRTFSSDSYKEHFSFIDNVKLCDSVKTTELDELLVNRIQSGNDIRFWLAVPDILEWDDHSGFVYSSGPRNETPGDDINFESLKLTLDESQIIDIDFLKNQHVIRLDNDGKRTKNKWSIYRCVYAEIKAGSGSTESLYILTDGSWYEIKKDFRGDIESEYAEIPKESEGLNLINYQRGEKEETYNERLKNSLNGYLFDKKPITITGRSPFEFCDVLTRDNKLIHVKRYSGSSALSHLFNQGYVSANLMLEYQIRKRVNTKNVDGFQFTEPVDPNKFEVIYGIISREDKDLDIPFFSKIMLVRTYKDLKKLGYETAIIKVKHEDSLLPGETDVSDD